MGVSRSRQTSISLMVRSSTPLARVDHHQRGIDRGQRAVGILGKILVARRVEQVDDAVAMLELHHRGGDRDTALLLHLHPVGSRMPRGLAALDRAGELNRAAEQQQLFGDAWSCRRRGGK